MHNSFLYIKFASFWYHMFYSQFDTNMAPIPWTIMVFTRFLSFSILCKKNNNLWFDDLLSPGILELITTLKIKKIINFQFKNKNLNQTENKY